MRYPRLTHLETLVVWLVVAGVAAADIIPIGTPMPTEPAKLTPELFTKSSTKIEELDKAIEAFKRREYEQSLDLFKKAKEKHDHLAPPRLMLGQLFIATNQVGRGRAQLEQAAVESPEHPGIYLNFATLALRENRVTDAALHLEKAAGLIKIGKWTEPQKRQFAILYHTNLATVATARRDWAGARDSLAIWVDLEPKNARARQRLAQALFHLDKPAEAAAELEKAAKDDPAMAPSAVAMGWLYHQKGDLKSAGEWMDKAVKTAPNEAKAHLGMGAWLLHQEKVDQAKASADTAGTLDPKSKEAKLLRGLIARYQKDPAAAERFFQSALDESPGDFQSANQLALVLAVQPEKEKKTRAQQLAEAGVRTYPTSAEAYSTLGWVYYQLGRLDDAEKALQTSISGGTATPETSYYLAHVMSDRGKLDAAKQLLNAAVQAKGNFLFRKEAQDWLERLSKKP